MRIDVRSKPQPVEQTVRAEQNAPAVSDPPMAVSLGFWGEAWRQFRKRRLAMLAVWYVGFLTVVAFCAPFIAGTKPIICKYKGNLYFPAMGYYWPSWENPVFAKDKFRRVYPKNLKEKDPRVGPFGHWCIRTRTAVCATTSGRGVRATRPAMTGGPAETTGSAPLSKGWMCLP